MADRIRIEVCCGGLDDAVAAQAGGADRIELNSALFLGGLTPSAGTIIETKRRVSLPVMVMIRPRAGGFCYSDNEMQTMLQDTETAVANSADGIVFGILTSEGHIDVARSRQVIERIGDKEIVFHRAFDVTPDPYEAVEQLIDLGVNRILTSGQKPTVPGGAALIREIIERYGDKIEILPGGGIRTHNIKSVIEQTGTTQVHVSAFKTHIDSSTQHHPDIVFGGSPGPPEDQYKMIDPDIVKAFIEAVS